MKKFSAILLFALLPAVFLHQPSARAAEKPAELYSINTDRIVIYSGDTVRSTAVGGVIESHCRGDEGIYYITIQSGGAPGAACIGFVHLQTGEIRFEKKLPVDPGDFTVKRFAVADGTAYILAEPRSAAGTERMLYRINLNTMEAGRLSDVLDFHADGRDLVLLSRVTAGIMLTRNEISVPVTLMGEGILRITAVMDGRMVFVTNGDETEIVDVRSGKALYNYSNNREFLPPVDYNLQVQVEDSQVSEQNDREMVIYKVFIDGVETGRTDSGPASLSREFRASVEANKYHLVKLERWVLNSAKGRYDRENNIRQPRAEQIFIPMNRIVKVSVKFDGKRYHLSILPVYK